jgi:hypothetical protein
MNGLEGQLVPILDALTKIRRPPNAFIIFAREWRHLLAAQFPTERNQEISKR